MQWGIETSICRIDRLKYPLSKQTVERGKQSEKTAKQTRLNSKKGGLDNKTI